MITTSVEADPQAYATLRPPCPPTHRRVLGLDLGTRVGVAIAELPREGPLARVPIYLDQWSLAIGDYDSGYIRFLRLRAFLQAVQPSAIVFEDVKFTPPAATGMSASILMARAATAAEFLGGLKVALGMWAEEAQVPLLGVGIGQIKKLATGKGNANKVDMIQATNEKFGLSFDPETYENTGVDNVCDALWALQLGLEHFAGGLQAARP